MAKLPFQLTNVIAIQQQCSQEGTSIDKGKAISKGEAVEKKKWMKNEEQLYINTIVAVNTERINHYSNFLQNIAPLGDESLTRPFTSKKLIAKYLFYCRSPLDLPGSYQRVPWRGPSVPSRIIAPEPPTQGYALKRKKFRKYGDLLKIHS